MKFLNREFTILEKAILILMICVLIGLVYYYFIDQPVKQGIREADEIISSCDTMTPALEARLESLEEMNYKLEYIKNTDGLLSMLASYNNGENEMNFLHEILKAASSYSVSFANVTKKSDLIRRNISISFSTDSYVTAKQILEALASCEYRCLISDIKIGGVNKASINDGAVSVSCNVTFYETMVGGKADAGLPVEKSESNTTGE